MCGRSLRHRAKAQLALPSVEDAHVGAVTFVQRSDSALRLNVHAHSLFLDGVYVRAPTGALAFHALGAPTFEEVQQVAQWTHAKIERVLLAHGRTLDGIGDEPAEPTSRAARREAAGVRARAAAARVRVNPRAR